MFKQIVFFPMSKLGFISKRQFHVNVIFCQKNKKKVKNKNYKAVFLGSDDFSVPSLIKLVELLGADNVSVVVSNVNNIVGKYANKNSLKTLHWHEYKTDAFDKPLVEEFGVVASFGYLIPQKVIQRFPFGILNVHASLLPRWRGAAPITHAIINGDSVTGISIMQIAPYKFDVGPVLHQSELSLDPHIKRTELTKILAHIGAETLEDVIKDLEHYIKNPIQQDESKAILSPKLIPEMAEFDWERKNSLEIYNLYRGLYGVYKLKTSFLDKKVDLDNLALVSIEDKSNICDKNTVNDPIYIVKDSTIFPPSVIPGQIIFKHDNIFVKCAESLNSKYLPYISVGKVKLGNKWMSPKDFQNGFLSKCKPEERVFKNESIKPVFSIINQ